MSENTDTKRILFVITKSNFGGAQRYVYELATAMKDTGYNVAVACGGSGQLIGRLAEAGIHVYPIKSFQRDIHFRQEIASVFELAHIIKEFDPDIVHLNSSKAGGTGAFVSRLLGVPLVIFTAHGWPHLEPRSWIWKTLAYLGSWATALLAHKIIAVSNNDTDHSPIWTKHKVHTIHTAVPKITFLDRDEVRSTLFETEQILHHKNDVWLVTNAELNRNKNLFVAIDAVKQFNQSSSQKIFYTIISDGELRNELETYIRKHELTDSVHLLGYVPDARQYLKAFDLFLLPSKKEGLPYAILESGAAELPTIASNVGGIPEVITHNKSGKLIDPYDHVTIVKALHEYANSPTERIQHAQVLSHTIRTQYSLSRMISETQTVYDTNASRT